MAESLAPHGLNPRRMPSAILPHRMARGVLAVAILCGLCAAGAQAAGDSAAPRLKFRSKGAVCVCSTDLDEQAIERAMSARAVRAAASAASGASAPQPGASSPIPVKPKEQGQ